MGLSLGFPLAPTDGPGMPEPMRQARAKVLAACKANKKFFLNTVKPETVAAMIDEGVMIRLRWHRGCRDRPQIQQATAALVTAARNREISLFLSS